jgi:hypothetical protein
LPTWGPATLTISGPTTDDLLLRLIEVEKYQLRILERIERRMDP